MSEQNPPGLPLQPNLPPYGFEKHLEKDGTGENGLRAGRICQPRVLKVGDILGNGDRVLSPPREGGNGLVWIHLTGGFDGHWIKVPARIPIALLTEADNPPKEMWLTETQRDLSFLDDA